MFNTVVKTALLLLLAAAPLASSAPAVDIEALVVPDVPDAGHPHPHSHTVHPHKHTHKHSHSHKKQTKTKPVKRTTTSTLAHTTTTNKKGQTTSSTLKNRKTTSTSTSTSTPKKRTTSSTSTPKKHKTTSSSTSTPKKRTTKSSTTSSSSSTTTSSSSSSTSTSSSSSSSTSSTISSTSSTTSTTSSSSSTTTQAAPTAAALPDTSCSNSGLAFAFYHNPYGINKDTTYSAFNPSYFKTVTPLVEGDGHSPGGYSGACASPSTVSVFGHTESCLYFTVQYKGYLYAPTSGTYTFTVAAPDDIVLLWLGPTAYSGWSRSNAVLDLSYFNAVKSQTYSYVAQAGQYVPMRIMHGQGDGPYGYNLTATAPSGNVLFSRTATNSPYIVQYSCSNLAPRFPNYGQET